jgi:hypothetical protein
MHVKGRNTVHCKSIKESELVSPFHVGIIIVLFFFYLGVFLKVYVLYDLTSFTALSPISFVPFWILYGKELVDFYIKHTENIKKKRNYIQNMIMKWGK